MKTPFRTLLLLLLLACLFLVPAATFVLLDAKPTSVIRRIADGSCFRRSCTNDINVDSHDDKKSSADFLQDRRSTLIKTTLLSTLWMKPTLVQAVSVNPLTNTVKPITGQQRDTKGEFPPITHTVFMDVRIARADGTFYVRDDPPGTIPTPENQVFYGRLILGLFGTVTPSHVQKFLKYVNVTYNPGEDDESPLPSYSRSIFKRLDQRTGLLIGGAIPGLEITSIGGSTALQYGSRIIPAQLWMDKTINGRISHSRGNLLTHRNLDITPEFGITTRAAPELDSTHTVFGCLLSDESSTAFLDRVIDLPTYSMDRAASLDVEKDGGAGGVIVDAASNLYTIQRDFFRGAAKSFGDSRLDKTFEGKLLRRVEVTQVGLMNL